MWQTTHDIAIHRKEDFRDCAGPSPRLSPAPSQYPIYMGKAGERWEKDFPVITQPDRAFQVELSNMKENEKRIKDATATAPPRTPHGNQRFSTVIIGREFWD